MRLSICSIKEAYAKTGLKPIQKIWRDGKYACPLNALCDASGKPMPDTFAPEENWKHAARILGLKVGEVRQFIGGWDGLPKNKRLKSPEFRKLGERARKEILGA